MFGVWNHSLEHLVHLLVAFILALPIGWQRAREEHSACLRTFALVAMASCGVVQTAVSVIGAGVANQANVLQGVITGIGFIGAGAIIRQGDFTTGNATAASIWTVGIIGAAVGYAISILASSWLRPILLSSGSESHGRLGEGERQIPTDERCRRHWRHLWGYLNSACNRLISSRKLQPSHNGDSNPNMQARGAPDFPV